MRRSLDKIFKSDIHVEIISFFHENPASIDTPRGVAAWTGYKKDVVKKALTDLTKADILIAHPVSSTTGYSYTHNKKVIKVIEKKLKKIKK